MIAFSTAMTSVRFAAFRRSSSSLIALGLCGALVVGCGTAAVPQELLDARAAKLPYVLDGAYSSVKNEAGLRADCTVSKRLGFNGRTLIYPGHIGPAREVYQPDPKEVAHYKQLVVEFEKAVAAGKAAVVYNDNMIDYAMFKRAKLFLANAALYEG